MDFVRSRGGDSSAPRVSATARQLFDAAKQLEDLDNFAAIQAYAETIAAMLYAGRLGEPGALEDAAKAARSALSRLAEVPRTVDLMLKGMAERLLDGATAGAAPLRVALDAMCELAQTNDPQFRRWMVPAFPILQESAAHELWDEAAVELLSTAAVR
jgi:hypothetical protein